MTGRSSGKFKLSRAAKTLDATHNDDLFSEGSDFLRALQEFVGGHAGVQSMLRRSVLVER